MEYLDLVNFDLLCDVLFNNDKDVITESKMVLKHTFTGLDVNKLYKIDNNGNNSYLKTED